MTTPPRSTSLAVTAAIAIAACAGPAAVRDVVIPAQAARSLIEMTAAPTMTLVQADATGVLGVRIRIHAPPLADAARPALNLALVLDTSASMQGDGIANVRSAAKSIVEQMADRDRVGLISFGSRARLVMASTALRGTGRATALAAIDQLAADGTTDLAAGLAMGLEQILAGRSPGGIDRLVLLADGFPNDAAPIPGLVRSAAGNQIAITTLGIGIEHSQEMLTQIAHDTGGVYRYAPGADEIAAVFRKELLRMQTLVARDLHLRIVPGPGVELGAAPWLAASGRQRVVALGDLAAGEIRDVIVPLQVPGHAAGLTVELLDADLGFTDALSNAHETRTAFVGVKASDDRDEVARSLHTDLVVAQARAEAAGAIIQAINLSRQGAVDQARELLAGAERAARQAADRTADTELGELADRMSELERSLAMIRVPPVVSRKDAMLRVPASAPPPAESAIRRAYIDATSAIDSR